jgi:hypothetical protein
MSLVDAVFSYGRLVWMIQSYVPLMLFYPDVHGKLYYCTFSFLCILTAVRRLLTFQVPNPISIFHHIGYIVKQSIEVRGSFGIFITVILYMVTGW